MSENKKDLNPNNFDFAEAVADFRTVKIPEIKDMIAKQKAKAASLAGAINSKRELLAAKRAEEEARLALERESAREDSSRDEALSSHTSAEAPVADEKEDKPEKAENVEKKKAQAPVSDENKQEIKPAEAAPAENVEEKTLKPQAAKPVDEQKQKPVKQGEQRKQEKVDNAKQQKKEKSDASKKQPEKPAEQAQTPEIGADGRPRRIYVPPTPQPKQQKPKVTTRIFENPQQSQRQGDRQRQQGGQAPRRPQLNAGAMPPPQMPAKGNQKGKNQKQNNNNNAGKNKYEDRSHSVRASMRMGYGPEDRTLYDENGDELVRGYRGGSKQKSGGNSQQTVITNAVITIDPVPIKTLSEKIGQPASQIVSKLFLLGNMKNINDSIGFDEAELVASEFGVTLEYKPDVTLEDTLSATLEINEVEDLDNLVERPPVVTIMGHVDHGKTSLLDYIRKSNITGGEAGGITQHIGAYTVTLDGKPITFLDTPGHEAFTSMRARGAQVTDIAILVVAADDGIMPQTIEAINHAKQAKVPMIVALNKMDKPGADPDRALSQLAEQEVVPEEWGGDTPVVRVSAKTGMGIENLLEQILVRAEVEELRANPNRPARGTIIEAKLDRGLGKIATILVQTGTLNVGDNVVAGVCTGKIRAMIDDKGRKVKKAGPSMPVSVTGWDDVPEAGDRIDVVADERFARQLAEERKLKLASAQNENTSISLNDLFDKISKGELKSVKLIIKADVQGSVEAVKQSLAKLGNDEVTIDIIHSAVGGIKESDVLLAETAGAIIIGFNVRPDTNAKALAAQKKIDIRFYDIIYNAIEDIEKAVKGLLAPKYREVVLGSAEIRELFKISGVGTVAGCHVVEGKVTRTAKARLIRNGKVEYTGEIASLRHGKDDVKEMAKNFDCGIMLQNYQDVKVGDVIEAFQMEQIDED